MKEELIVDNAEMAKWISDETGVDERTVGTILELELEYLSKKGIAMDDEEYKEERMQQLLTPGKN